MKNKDKYDLRKLEIKNTYQVNGCGKAIPSTRTLEVRYEGSVIYTSKSTEALLTIVFNWLESEENPLK